MKCGDQASVVFGVEMRRVIGWMAKILMRLCVRLVLKLKVQMTKMKRSHERENEAIS